MKLPEGQWATIKSLVAPCDSLPPGMESGEAYQGEFLGLEEDDGHHYAAVHGPGGTIQLHEFWIDDAGEFLEMPEPFDAYVFPVPTVRMVQTYLSAAHSKLEQVDQLLAAIRGCTPQYLVAKLALDAIRAGSPVDVVGRLRATLEITCKGGDERISLGAAAVDALNVNATPITEGEEPIGAFLRVIAAHLAS